MASAWQSRGCKAKIICGSGFARGTEWFTLLEKSI
jgi:hypothetical protein